MSEDQERADELAEDRLWRMRNGLPTPFEEAAQRIRESGLQAELDEAEQTFHDSIIADAAQAAGVTPEQYLADLAREQAASQERKAAAALMTMDLLRAAIATGSPCSRLFDIAKVLDPKSPHREEANRLLREVGCFSRQSERTDGGSVSPDDES